MQLCFWGKRIMFTIGVKDIIFYWVVVQFDQYNPKP